MNALQPQVILFPLLSRSELTEAMAELGRRPTDEDMDVFMEEFDLDGSGTIELVSSRSS